MLPDELARRSGNRQAILQRVWITVGALMFLNGYCGSASAAYHIHQDGRMTWSTGEAHFQKSLTAGMVLMMIMMKWNEF